MKFLARKFCYNHNMGEKKTAGAVLKKVTGYEKLLDITFYDSRGSNRNIHLHCCSISLLLGLLPSCCGRNPN